MSLDDELVNRVTWKIPNALALVGSRAGDERNAMTTSWITQLSMRPVLIGVSVDNKAVTHRLISEGGSFTVNLWDAEDTRPFVKFSKPARYDPERSTLNDRPVRDGVTGALRDVGDVEGMADAASTILRDRVLWDEMSVAAAADARARFSTDDIVSRYEAFYERTLG